MAEIWAAAVGAGAALYGAYNQSQAAKKAGQASQNAANSSIGEQRREFNIAQQNQAPWLDTGKAALSRLAGLYNLNTAYGSQNFDGTVGGNGSSNADQFNQFYNSPDYQFALNQGLQGLDRSAAARGSLGSGGHSADVLNYAQGLASQQFNNYANRLAGLAGVGQATAQNLGTMGMNEASNIGNLLTNNAQRQGQSIYDQSNAINNGLNNLSYGFGNLAGGQNWFGTQENSAPKTADTQDSNTQHVVASVFPSY